jgi:5-formyltetrahydrofolate cyclo-ligase
MADQLVDAKKELRREAIARRDAVSAGVRAAAADAIVVRPFTLPIVPGVIVSGFMPLGSEINPLPLMRKLAGEGARLALPVVGSRGKPLVMREWAWGGPLAAGIWGIREPLAEAAEVEPDILLVPLLAFDRKGFRIGYGGGYYDRTITLLRARKTVVALGLAYAVQEVPAVPVTPRDARLDLVLTERDVIDLRGG